MPHPDYLKKAKSGVNEVDLLHTYIKSCSNVGTDYFAPWPAGSRSVLQQGVPTEARHIVVHGFYSFRTKSGPIIVVGAIQYLAEGGNVVDAYSYLPITLDELEKILYRDFSVQTKQVFVNRELYSVMKAKSKGVTLLWLEICMFECVYQSIAHESYCE